MLIQPRTDDQKTIMGLFSLVPDLRDVNHLNEVMATYEQEGYELFFFQDEPHDPITGLLGYEFYKEKVILVRRVIVTPGSPKKATQSQMLTDLQEQYPEKTLMGTFETQTAIDKWRKHY
ncbi:riboflavin biosynthesis protein RibT [Fructobacillus sp. M1-13]|uniref:Riboflavin biosynthesis protein RibT n=1 Tax=Fructobacillus papyriferae TaxID=2713171 RepID=A0ABS5QP42_9LACO|nr:riboflavin biosynthesis protein RibT [Fructobacillus papyriferae]MBS9334642.1 riboflavin biosynthesis protein RibT [Fructobacillus papyriferae]MCD2158632.1 riboflavin biosynthesis protein RibT [Fructobacillus papyriferae]